MRHVKLRTIDFVDVIPVFLAKNFKMADHGMLQNRFLALTRLPLL